MKRASVSAVLALLLAGRLAAAQPDELPPGAAAPHGETPEPAAAPGSASPPPPQPAPSATPYALTPLPPPTFDPSVRRHDGFYLRMALGAGYFHDSIDSSLVGDASLSGATLISQLALGGTIAPGLVLGGGSFGTSVLGPRLEIDGETDGSPELVSMSLLGLFADWYFDDRRGLHVQALAGFGLLAADDSTWAEQPKGFGGSLGVGHEWWIAPQWSVGVLASVNLAALRFEDDGITETHVIVAPGLLAAFTYH